MPQKKLLKWSAVGFAGLFLLTMVGGRSYQLIAESRDRERFPPPGQLTEIEGTSMHLHCSGVGSPTVVVEQGLGSLNETWAEIIDGVLATTRTCYYDRVGKGYSEPVDHLVQAPEVASRLHQLLQSSGENSDVVLVGWSAGGIYIREYYKQFPENVKGMVFVDSSHEQQGYRMPQAEGGSGDSSGLEIDQYLAPFGLLRLFGVMDSRVRRGYWSEDVGDRVVAHWNMSHAAKSRLQNIAAFSNDTNQEYPPSALGNLPLTVLSQGMPVEQLFSNANTNELEFQMERRSVWNQLQRELAALSSNSHHIIAHESGHGIHRFQPELLINAIRDIVATVRVEMN